MKKKQECRHMLHWVAFFVIQLFRDLHKEGHTIVRYLFFL
jgi:hypothetical protein